jgi:hypothetical protein
LNRQDTCTDALRKKRGRPENSVKVPKPVEIKVARTRQLLPNSQKPVSFRNSMPVIAQLVPKIAPATIVVPTVTVTEPIQDVKSVKDESKNDNNLNLNTIGDLNNNNDLNNINDLGNINELDLQIPTDQLLVDHSLDIDDNSIEILQKWLPKIQNNPGEFANVENPQDFDELVLTFATLQKLQGY